MDLAPMDSDHTPRETEGSTLSPGRRQDLSPGRRVDRQEPDSSDTGSMPLPPLPAAEDGYLGDCSSDGGNEKNFPMPAHLLKRLATNKDCPCHPEKAAPLSDSEVAEP